MLIVAVLGLLFNLIQMRILHTGDGHYHLHENNKKPEEVLLEHLIEEEDHHQTHFENLNVKAAYLHVLGDMLMSVGVIVAALLIFLSPKLWFMDPLCTYVFSIMVGLTTIPVASNCIHVLMEGSPIDTNDLLFDIWALIKERE